MYLISIEPFQAVGCRQGRGGVTRRKAGTFNAIHNLHAQPPHGQPG